MSADTDLGPIMVDIRGHELTAGERELIAHPNVGGVILFTRNYESPKQLTALCRELHGIGRQRRLLAVDYEGGRVQRFRSGFSPLPAMGTLGAQYLEDRDGARHIAERIGLTIARELTPYGIDLCFAPVLDRDYGSSEVIGDRAFSADVACIVSLATALRRGLLGGGMVATGKHFPGHGYVAADSHLELPVDERDERTLRADMMPFRRLIERGLESVMMAHIRYPAVDDWPASLSKRWIGTELREALGFEGAVFCDDLSMNGARLIDDPIERAARAITAGCDMVPICNDPDTAESVVDGLPVTPRGAASRRLKSLYQWKDRA